MSYVALPEIRERHGDDDHGLYENVDDANFDPDYDLRSHRPLVDEKFKPFGIKGWRVLKAVGAPFGGRPAYGIIANLEFDSGDPFLAAVAAERGPAYLLRSAS